MEATGLSAAIPDVLPAGATAALAGLGPAGLFISPAPFWILVWAGALMVTAALAARHMPVLRAFGIGLMTVPLWTAFWGFIDSIPLILDTGSSIGTASRARLSRMYYRSLVIDLGYLGAGFLFWSTGGRLSVLTRLGVRGLARRLREAGLPLGRGEAASLVTGVLLFPLLLGAAVAADQGLRLLFPGLVSGDESSFFANMTVYHALMISIAAGITEELVYRGLLLVLLAKGLQRLWPDRPAAPWLLAIPLQALLFGLAHGGYGTWIHVIVPALFGLVTGLVAWRWGLWAAIALHVLVDVYAFGFYTIDTAPAFGWVLGVFLLLNVAVSLGAAGAWAIGRVRARAAA